ncbi:MAG: hypothetical protein KC416_14280 [Myxococcales bacterium]|nr:hypothetical protein [Myxococcales bacterium]
MVQRRFTVILFIASLGGFVVAQGQDGAGEVTLKPKAVEQLDASEQKEEANRISQNAVDLSVRISKLLAEAQTEKDIIRVTCLNDKLTQANAHVKTAEQRTRALQLAANDPDPSARNHEYTVISVLEQRLKVLKQEADQCLGQDLFDMGELEVTSSIDPRSRTFGDATETTDPPPPPVPYIPPPESSTM